MLPIALNVKCYILNLKAGVLSYDPEFIQNQRYEYIIKDKDNKLKEY